MTAERPTSTKTRIEQVTKGHYDGISESVNTIVENAKHVTDPEDHQKYIRVVDEVLKLLSQHQRNIGELRKVLGKQNESLRRTKPKGAARNTESVPFTIDGKVYQLVNGKPELIEISGGVREPEGL